MTDANLFASEWEHDLSEAPFHARMSRVGHQAGARELGAALYEMDPGGTVSPYHLHHGNEELLVVLEGTPQLRTSEGVRTLAAGAVVAFSSPGDKSREGFPGW